VAFNPTVYAWAGVVHPDMLQALCLLIALFCTVAAFEKPTTGRILVSSVLAGLAFAAKYSGLFVLPLIASALLGRRAIASRHGADRRIGVIRAVTTAAAVVVLIGGLAIDGQWIVTHITADGHVDVPLPVSLDALVWIIRAFGALLVLAAATPWTWRLFRRWTSAETVFWGFAVAAAAFVMTFVVASPYSFVKLAFLKGLYYEAVETGAAINVLWVETWTRGVFTTVGLPIVVALAGTLLAWLVDRRRRSALEIILWGWIVVYILVLLAPVHELAVYYALPLVAPAAILAARGAIGITEILAWRLPRVPRRATAALAITILAGFELSSVAALSQIRRAVLLRERAPVVLAGEWLTARVPPTSRVAYHYLTYVPPAFTNVAVTWGASRAWLTAFDPDVVVVNRDVVS
jgi:4-amino-4-deoxy-L-arabinose transferase-like glycosyltransferase